MPRGKVYDYEATTERWAEKYLKPRKVPGNAYHRELLDNYVRSCIGDMLGELKLYRAWVCMTCLSEGVKTGEIGEKPPYCPTCKSRYVYNVNTDNARVRRCELMVWQVRTYLEKCYPGAITEDNKVKYIRRWRDPAFWEGTR